jgi:aryl-alcohol dehydrogenase-like predicted oxidoreductase
VRTSAATWSWLRKSEHFPPIRAAQAQLALAWVLAQGDDIVPIPGTKRRQYLEENVGALDVRFTPQELVELDTLLPPGAAVGARYPEGGMRAVNQ